MHQGSRETPFRFDNGTNTWIEGSLFFNEWESSRIPVSATITHFAEEFLDANHELKFGVQFVRASSEGIDGVPGGVQYFDFDGAPDRASFQDTSISKSTVRTVGSRVVSPACIAGVRISRPNFRAPCGRMK